MTSTSTAVIPSQSWLSQSVQEFWASFNWEDIPPVVLPPLSLDDNSQTGLEEAAPLSLSLSVHDFFNQFAWDETPAIAALPAAPVVSSTPETNKFTLEDFAGLF